MNSASAPVEGEVGSRVEERREGVSIQNGKASGADKDERVVHDGGPPGLESAPAFDSEGAMPVCLAGGVTEAIIDQDDRIRIRETSGFPWRAVCALRIQAANGTSWLGTGWLAAPRVVVTAGHCVYMHDQGGWAAQIEVVPGQDGSVEPFGAAFSRRFGSVVGWTRDRETSYDYGVIVLPKEQPLGESVGCFGFSAESDGDLAGRSLNLSGYPGDQDRGTQWWHARVASSLEPRAIRYAIDTASGQSGAPVWRVEGATRYVVGIHTNGRATGNWATRIEEHVYDNLMAWRAESA